MTSYKIEVEGLRKQFGDLVVLRDINLKVEEGAVIALIGPSGSGKSTLLRCLQPARRARRRARPRRRGCFHVPRARTACPATREQARFRSNHGHGVPALQPIPAYERAAKRHGRPHVVKKDAKAPGRDRGAQAPRQSRS